MAASRGLGKGLDIMLPDKIGTSNAEGKRNPKLEKM